MDELFCLVGKKVHIRILIAIITVLWLLISVSFQTDKRGPLAILELKSVNTQGMILHMDLLSTVTQNFDHAENFSCQNNKLDNENLGTCNCSVSGNRWTVIEERKLRNFDSEGSNSSLSKRVETSQEHQSVLGALPSTVPAYEHTVEPHNREIKQGAYHVNDNLTSSSQCQIPMDKSFSDETAGPSKATYQDEVNGSLLQSFGNNIKNHYPHADSNDNLEENNLEAASNDVNIFKNNFWSFLFLTVLLLDEIFNFIGHELDIGIGVVGTMVLGLGIPELVESGLSAFPWFNIPILMYLMAYALLFLWLIFTSIWRERLSYIMAGAACVCSTFGIISVVVSLLPLEYAFVVIILTSLAVLYGYTAEAADQRRAAN